MKIIISICLVFITCFFSLSQNKIFLNNQGDTINELVHIRFQNPDTILLSSDFFLAKIEHYDQTIIISCENHKPKSIKYVDFMKSENHTLDIDYQFINEVTVLSKAVRKESADSMHVVDFHFINGNLFTIEKSIFNHKIKFLCANNECIEVDKNAKLVYKNLYNRALIEVKDSVFYLENKKLIAFLDKKQYLQKFDHLIGQYKDDFYYKNRFFYGLIDEYSSYNLRQKLEQSLHFTYDSLTCKYISSHYFVITPQHNIFLVYNDLHQNAGRKFRNLEGIQISNLNAISGQVFKYLYGSPEFVEMTAICEKSRSEAFLLDSTLYVIDFNKRKLYTYIEQKLQSEIKIELQNEWYKNNFRIDELEKKAYFYFKTDIGPQFLEIDFLSGQSRFIHIPRSFSSFYHWEISGGRLYFLISDSSLEWQRIFYSVSIGDKRF
jgi:hypothetical protein